MHAMATTTTATPSAISQADLAKIVLDGLVEAGAKYGNGNLAAAEAMSAAGTHFPPKAKRVIVLWQGGAPSQIDLFDYKPGLEKHRLEELPESSERKGAGTYSLPFLRELTG